MVFGNGSYTTPIFTDVFTNKTLGNIVDCDRYDGELFWEGLDTYIEDPTTLWLSESDWHNLNNEYATVAILSNTKPICFTYHGVDYNIDISGDGINVITNLETLEQYGGF